MTGYLCDDNGRPYDAGTFDLDAYLSRINPRLLESSEGRRVLTRLDPMLWAIMYVPHLLKSPDGQLTFGDVHLELYRDALELVREPGPQESRRAYVAPRGSGKSTTLFLAIPLWAAAHGWIRFVAAFSSSATQAQDHLAGLRRELQTNKLLRADYPDLATPARKMNGTPVADSQSMLHTKSGFSFAARGIDTEVLGLVDPENRRPDMLLLDDIEGEEGAGYSAYQAKKRLITVLDGIMPMNDRAHLRLIGTVNLPNGILHQCVKAVTEPGPPAPWIAEQKIRVTYFPPLVDLPDGTRRSLWPGRWSTEHLESIAHTRAFAKSFKNMPVNEDGDYWTPEDFAYGDVEATKVLLQIDPAVTDKRTSDFHALAVVAYEPGREGRMPRCAVRYARAFRMSPEKLRTKVLEILQTFPEIGAVRIEVNQGGQTWRAVLHDLPVKLLVHTESAPKKVRATWLLNHYQRGRVLHAAKLPEVEEQMCAFPDVLNDDLVDAVGAAVRFFLDRPKVRAGATTTSYVKGAA
jgi:phage terminase large subunit-like protein